MKTPKQPFVLFFCAGMVPTAEELSAASKLRARIGYRNASVVNENDVPEPCEGVAGAVPVAYKKCKTAEAAIAEFDARLESAVKNAEALVDKPRTAGTPAASSTAPKGFDKLPGGDGAVGAPVPAAAPAAAPVAPTEPAAAPAATPAAEAGAKPPAWPAAGKK